MNHAQENQGILYIVATPIGNLRDVSERALQVLREVGLIAVEDTRHSKKLLAHYGIGTPLSVLHEHNEREVTAALLASLERGESVAVISDAGTPLISDPGFYLVRAARRAGFRIVPVPGPCALIAALSVAGLPTDRFVFEGFLPPKSAARRQRLKDLASEPRTLVCYESSHRIGNSLADMAAVLGAGREATLARELTKTYETIRYATLGELADWVQADGNQQKGEFVIVVHGAKEQVAVADGAARHVLEVLLSELPLRQAASLAARITGVSKNVLYELGVQLKAAQQQQ
jgi:16S rRNA (cytidine1402-2'-O)-methyltransferase